jgi:hypothetical protein
MDFRKVTPDTINYSLGPTHTYHNHTTSQRQNAGKQWLRVNSVAAAFCSCVVSDNVDVVALSLRCGYVSSQFDTGEETRVIRTNSWNPKRKHCY